MDTNSLLFNTARKSYRWFRSTFHLYDAEDKLVADSQKFWTDPDKLEEGQYSHYRGTGIFKDDQKWLAVGKQSLDIFMEFVRAIDYKGPMETMLDWGCGGGANAVHFVPIYNKMFYGLDVYDHCLKECARQLDLMGEHNYKMLEIDASNPEKALEDVTEPLDLFFCIYVMEVFPSKAYTERILDIAYKMTKPGGLIYLQYKYTMPRWDTQPKRWNYSNDPPNMTSYWTDEFWTTCEKHGLMPKVMKLIPYQPLVTDSRYAYVLCVRE